MELTRGGFTQTRNHWWWRPGWGPGASYATSHLTFELAPEAHLAASLDGLDGPGLLEAERPR